MSYKIIVDSCGELPESLKGDKRFQNIPLGLEVGDYHTMDDEKFNQADFLARVAACPVCAKSSCPSPEKYMESFLDADRIYVITLSQKLSGSYNSAELGKKLYLEKYGKKDIAVIDSKSASCGETQLALMAMDLEEEGRSFDEIEKALIHYRENMNTYFVLDNLETLRKNGRLTGVKALVATTLNIKPVMGADDGSIVQRSQSIGIKKALTKMADLIASEVKDGEKKRLIISHCNCLSRAECVKDLLLKKKKFKEVIILDTAGISSMYANDGGVIISI